MLDETNDSTYIENTDKLEENQSVKNFQRMSNVTSNGNDILECKTSQSHSDTVTSINNGTSQQSLNINQAILSQSASSCEVPMMSVPLAVPFSGLSTIPIALCPVNTLGGNNVIQPAGAVMSQSGLVLLNMLGNNAGITGIPQFVACNQLSQSMQPVVGSTANASQTMTSASSSQSSVSLQSQQTTPSVAAMPQMIGSMPQLSVQSSMIPQATPTAYMLVPIHQIPNNNQTTVQSQQEPDVTVSKSTDSHSAPAEQNQISLTETSVSSNISRSPGTSTLVTSSAPQPRADVLSQASVRDEQPSSSTTLSIPALMRSLSSVPSCLETACTPTIASSTANDSHISSCFKNLNNEHSSSPLSVTSLQAVQKSEPDPPEQVALTKFQLECNQTLSVESVLSTAKVDSETGTLLCVEDVICSTNHTAAATTQGSNSDGSLRTAEKRKKGPAPKLFGNEVCTICSDKASGYHYGILSCEGCKGFFRRSIIKNSNFQCKNNGECRMDTYTRRKCQACRLKKCRSVGMKDESVFSEDNPGGGKSKRTKKENVNSSSHNIYPDPSMNHERIPSLTSHQRNIVEMLQANENRYQWPMEEDVDKVTPWIELGDSMRCRTARFAHFTELSILIVQLVVEFTKQLPGFLSVSREDQIILLKACTIEVMLLRAAKQYDKNSKAINFLNGRYYDKSSFYRAGMQVEFVDPIFDFCKSMAKLGLDEAEYALLVAINTFSTDRPNLKDLDKIEAVQDSYIELLRVYLKIHHPSDPLMFPRTLMKLVELRTLNNYHSEQIFALKVQDKQLPPLLAEIWDM